MGWSSFLKIRIDCTHKNARESFSYLSTLGPGFKKLWFQNKMQLPMQFKNCMYTPKCVDGILTCNNFLLSHNCNFCTVTIATITSNCNFILFRVVTSYLFNVMCSYCKCSLKNLTCIVNHYQNRKVLFEHNLVHMTASALFSDQKWVLLNWACHWWSFIYCAYLQVNCSLLWILQHLMTTHFLFTAQLALTTNSHFFPHKCKPHRKPQCSLFSYILWCFT